jgi:acetyl esterase/lipase
MRHASCVRSASRRGSVQLSSQPDARRWRRALASDESRSPSILGGIDPLLSDGELLAAVLEKASVQTTRPVEEGVTHAFFGMDAALDLVSIMRVPKSERGARA